MAYNTDIEYTEKFYSDWSLSNLKLQCALKGIEMPTISKACELGYGQGITINLLAANGEVSWFGTDFLPAHADNAQILSGELDNHAHLYNLSFKEFSEVKDLPTFDLIVLHGILSWVSEENQNIILDFIHDRLADNGLVYISYNARPGGEDFKPAQYLMSQLRAEFSKNDSDPIIQINDVSSFMESFHQTLPKYLQSFPNIERRLQGFKNQNPKYLIHEYFNSDWHSFFFSEVANKLSKVGLSYLGQSRLNEELPALNFTNQQLEFITSSNVTGSLEHDLKDAMCNRRFRRDIWVKSPKPLSKETSDLFLKETFVVLARPISSLNLNIQGLAVTAKMNNALYQRLLKKLSDYKEHSLNEILNELSITSAQLLEMLGLLHVKGIVGLCSDDYKSQERLQKVRRANRYMIHKAVKHQKEAVLLLPRTDAVLPIDYWLSLYLHLAFNEDLQPKQAVEKMIAYIKEHDVDISQCNSPEALHIFIRDTVKNIETHFLEFFIQHKVIES